MADPQVDQARRTSFRPIWTNASGTYTPYMPNQHKRSVWFHCPEAGAYKELITTGGAENVDRFHVVAPQVDQDVTLHSAWR